jgi:aryl-alcohol dehydrogenase-like predicted oxidoreductase
MRAGQFSRRDFLGLAGGVFGVLIGSAGAGPAETGVSGSIADVRPADLPRVRLGKTGYRVTRAALGGSGIPALPTPIGVRIVQDAYRAGINYFDTASTYGDGKSEKMIGLALKEVRDKVVIATKTLRRQKQGAEREIEESLARLQIDSIDILQIHAVNTFGDWKAVTSANGSLRAAESFMRAGRVKHIGITGHRLPEVVITALKEYAFATVLLPISAADAGYRDFGAVVDYARSRGIGVIGMKVLAAGRLINAVDPRDCLRYTLSRGVDTAIVGFSAKSHIEDAVTVAAETNAWTRQQRAALEQKAKPFANTSVLWWKRD